jgi:predicted double-glycine peptidase
MVLNYWGDRIDQLAVGMAIDPEHDGTPWSLMVDYAKRRGFEVHVFDEASSKHFYWSNMSSMDELKMWVSRDYPVIVCQRYGIPGPYEREGHYRVVIGYDDRSRIVYTADPAAGYYTFSYDKFNEIWAYSRCWGMVISKAGATPRPLVLVYTISIIGLPFEISTAFRVDGGPMNKIQGGTMRTLSLPAGNHTIAVEPIIEAGKGVRYYCANPKVAVSGSGSYAFEYVQQFYLAVRSPYGEVKGEGWYDKGASARFSVSPSRIQLTWYSQLVFDSWRGDSTESTPSASVLMDAPKSVEAAWRADYTMLYAALAGAAIALIAIVAVLMLIYRSRRKGDRGP